MVSKIFGSGSKSSSKNVSGFAALTPELQGKYTDLIDRTESVLQDPERFFKPMGMTEQEQMAGQMIDPANLQQNLQNYLNPYRDIISQDINRQFEGAQGALASRASEAGAFGGSRMREGQADLERARLDAIQNAMSGQYNQAFGQMQQGIGNLLGFGGLQRQIDLQQRGGGIPESLQFASGIYSPLLGGSSGESTERGATEGWLGQAGGFLTGLGAVMPSDKRLKDNIKPVGKQNGHNIYEFTYKDDKEKRKYIGVMAQDIEKTHPEAIYNIGGYMAVDYGKINVDFREVG